MNLFFRIILISLVFSSFAIAVDSEEFSKAYDLAKIYARDKEFEKAKEFYIKAVELDPSSAMAHNGLGYVNYELGDLESAEKEYNAAVELDPDIPQFYNNLGIIAFHREHYETAEAYYKKAIELDPKYAKAMVNLSSTYIKMGNYWGGYMEYLNAQRTDKYYVEERKKSEKAQKEIKDLKEKYDNGEIK